MKKKTLVLLLIVATYTGGIKAQNERLFQALGYTVYLDYVSGPVTLLQYKPGYYGNTVPTFEQFHSRGFSYFTLIYRIGYNILEPSDNFGVSISASPAAGIYFDLNDEGYGLINVPIMLGAEFGAGSTYNSTSTVGGFLHAGIELTKAPLIMATNYTEMYTAKPVTFWTQPVVSTGIRYWSKNNHLRELNVKVGFGKEYSFYDGGSYTGTTPFMTETRRQLSARLSFLYYLNY